MTLIPVTHKKMMIMSFKHHWLNWSHLSFSKGYTTLEHKMEVLNLKTTTPFRYTVHLFLYPFLGTHWQTLLTNLRVKGASNLDLCPVFECVSLIFTLSSVQIADDNENESTLKSIIACETCCSQDLIKPTDTLNVK